MNIKLKKFNTLFTLLGLLSIGSLSANGFQLGKVRIGQASSSSKVFIEKADPTFADLYEEIREDLNLRNVLLNKDNNDAYKVLYYKNKEIAIISDKKLSALGISYNQDIRLTTPVPEKPKTTNQTKTDTTDTNNNDDKKSLWQNHKYKFIIGGTGAGALILAGGAYLILNSGETTEIAY